MIFDFYSDPEMAVIKDIVRHEGKEAIPECVKSASSLIPSEEFRSEKRAFAWPQAQRFPLDTEADVWLSAQYFKKTAAQVPIQYRDMVATKIATAAEIFGVDVTLPSEHFVKDASGEDPRPMVERVYGIRKSQNAVSDMLKTASEETIELTEVEAVKAANASFPHGLEDRSGWDKHVIAREIKTAAEKFNLPLNPLVDDWAYAIKRSSVVDQMQARWAHCVQHNNRAGVVEGIQKQASSYMNAQFLGMPAYPQDVIDGYALLAEKAASVDVQDMKAVANFCAKLDELSGLNKVAGFVSAERLDRAVVDDMAPKFVKLAGHRVPMEALRGLDELTDLVPGVGAYLDHPVKMAHVIESAPEMNQKALFLLLRRVHG